MRSARTHPAGSRRAGILLIGGVGAFVRTYRVWRDEGTWWGWQGAGWFLMTLMLLTLTMGFPVLAGPLFG